MASRQGLPRWCRSILRLLSSRRKNAYSGSSGRICRAECPAACGWLDRSAARSILGRTPKGADASLKYAMPKRDSIAKD